MKNRKGFISMSIIYSFFAVFTLVSSSLLLVYSNNLSVVKEQNREIKKDLLQKSNEAMMSFKNLISDGGFEKASQNWIKFVDPTASRNTILNKRIGIGNDAEHYYSGRGALCLKGQEKGASLGAANYHNYVVNKNVFSMYTGHFYYIARVYFAWNDINKDDKNELVLKLVKQQTGINGDNVFSLFDRDEATGILNAKSGVETFDILNVAKGYNGASFTPNQYYNTDINKEKARIASGFCLGVNGRCAPKEALETSYDQTKIPVWIQNNSYVKESNGKRKIEGGKYVYKEGYANETFANTLESGIFEFSGKTGLYYLLVGEQFRTETANENQQITYCTDDYILIDLTVALQKSDFDLLSETELREFTRKVDFLIDGRFFNGLKVFSAARADLS